MMSWPCGRRSAGKSAAWRSGSLPQCELICGVSELVNQVSKMSVSAEKPPGCSRCLGAIARRHVGRRIHRQRAGLRQDRPRVVALAVRVERVPDRDRHAEIALAADAPVLVQVARPVLVALPHVRRVPDHLGALREQPLAVLEQLHEPLARRHELERPLALLEELHRVLDRLRLAAQRRAAAGDAGGRIAQQLDDPFLRRGDALAADFGVRRVRCGWIQALVALAAELDAGQAPVAPDELAQRQAVLAPPLDVALVAERAHHQDAGALLGVGLLAGEDRHRHAEERRDRALAEEAAVARVVRVRGDADARGEQLRPRRRDHERAASLDGELEIVIGARTLAVLELGLRDRALEVHVPERRRVAALDLALREEVEKRVLRDPARVIVDGLVLVAPVDRQPQPLPELLERLLVERGHALAGLDEVRTRDAARRLAARRGVRLLEHEPGLVWRARVAADVEEVLDAALGRQAVVVPAHRVEDVAPGHALEARQQVRLRVREDVARVQRARRGWRRRVDHEALGARPGRVVAVDAALLPGLVPAPLRRCGVEVLRKAVRIDRTHAAGRQHTPPGARLRPPGPTDSFPRPPTPVSARRFEDPMAKTSQVLRDRRRKKLIKKHAAKRAELRGKLNDPEVSIEEKLEVQKQFAKLPRNSCPTRLNRRCEVSGRSRSYYRKFSISRIALRELALKGQLPGVRKSSW